MNEATIYMTDGNEYVVDYDEVEQTYTTVTFYVDGKIKTVFSKFNMLCMDLIEQNLDNCEYI